MKKVAFVCAVVIATASCNSVENKQPSAASTETTPMIGQSGVQDDVSNPNIVQTAVKSPDHTTLVAAVKAAGMVDALSNAGPFTVFAPTNTAFDALPSGTVEELLKPEKKNDLSNILEYHTYVGSLSTMLLSDGKDYQQVNGQRIRITKQGDRIFVNGDAEIIASIPTSNGIIHVIDKVLLP